MCKYCESGKVGEIITEITIQEPDFLYNLEKPSGFRETTYIVVIEYGILRLVDSEDTGCLSNGSSIVLYNCPFCGYIFREEVLKVIDLDFGVILKESYIQWDAKINALARGEIRVDFTDTQELRITLNKIVEDNIVEYKEIKCLKVEAAMKWSQLL